MRDAVLKLQNTTASAGRFSSGRDALPPLASVPSLTMKQRGMYMSVSENSYASSGGVTIWSVMK